MSVRDFAGKSALVTGSAGIARAVALRLARAHARVTALGISVEENAALMQAAVAEGLPIQAVLGDVSVEEDVDRAVGKAVEHGGGLDIIVNAAATHPYGDAVETDWATWRKCLDVNVGGMFLTAHFGIPAVLR